MVQHLPVKKDISITIPEKWGDTPLICWNARGDIEELRESSTLHFRITPISQFSGWNDFNPENCYQWKVRQSQRTLEKNLSFTPDRDFILIRERMQKWLQGLQRIKSLINNYRKIRSPESIWECQGIIYKHKVEEALKLKNGAATENLIFLPLEAEERKVTVEQLADQILLWDQIDRAYLAKTESMRVRCLLRYRQAFDNYDQDIDSLIKEMHDEIYDHQQT